MAQATRHAIGDAAAETSTVLQDLLASTAMFADLPGHVMARLQSMAELLLVPANTVLCRQGDLANRLFILLEGQVTLSNAEHRGVSAVVEVVRPGGHFILTAVLAQMPYLMTAQTTMSSRVIALDAEPLLQAIHQEPVLASAILRAEAIDFGAMVRQVCDLKLRTTAQRLGSYLIELSDPQAENSATFRLPFDKRLLAAKLGCRQENLSRAFAALRNLGVETHGARVTLHDIAKLRDYAQVGSAEDASPAGM
jgi:CRP/FNR family transcriptional activator FtrB